MQFFSNVFHWIDYISLGFCCSATERNIININQFYTKHSTNQFNILFKLALVFHILLSVNLHHYSLWRIPDFSIALLKMMNLSGKPLCLSFAETNKKYQHSGNSETQLFCTPQSRRLGERAFFSFHIYIYISSVQEWRRSQTAQNDGLLTQMLKEALSDDLPQLQL